MLDDNIPIIEESVTNSGETKFNSNLPIMLNAFAKLETIMKSKVLLQSAIAKTVGAETKGMSQPVLERSRLTDTYEN
jgi:hypothetical protein